MIVHKGELIEKAVRKCKFPITLLAERLGKSRQHIYNLFENPDVPLDLILKIGKIIQYDFNKDLKEIAQIPNEYKLYQLSEPDITFESAKYWKSKYFELLDQHQLLLKDKLEEFFRKTY